MSEEQSARRTTPDDKIAKSSRGRSRPADLEAALDRNRSELSKVLAALQEKLGLDDVAPADIGRGLMSGANVALKTARRYPKAALAVGGGLALILASRQVFSSPDTEEDWPDLGGDDWFVAATRIREEAEADLARIDEDEAVHDEKRRQGLSSRGAAARDFKAERAAVRDGLADDLEAAFRIDLDDLSKPAQDEMALMRAKQYRQETARPGNVEGILNAVLDHPIASSAVTLAIGTAVAALRSGHESDDLAAERERLTRRARELVEEERDNAARMADLAARELARRG